MTTSRPSLPEYAHPPLVAATLGVYFSADELKLDQDQLSAFQQRLGPEWAGRWRDIWTECKFEEQDFGIELAGHQLTNVLGDRVVRVTSYLFSFTWLGTADGRYPRYENLRDGFVMGWDQFSSLFQVKNEQVYTWVVSYLNRIPQGTVWQTSADWKFLKLQPQSDEMSARLERAQWQLTLPELNDALAVSWAIDAQPIASELPVIWIKLTADGDVHREDSSILNGMDAGRAAIVKTFSDLMSPAANAYWGLRRRET